jgi:hypothetical protein
MAANRHHSSVKQINQLESNEKIPLSVLLSVGGTAVDKVLALRGEPSFTIQHDGRLDWERQQMAGLLDLIKMFNPRLLWSTRLAARWGTRPLRF